MDKGKQQKRIKQRAKDIKRALTLLSDALKGCYFEDDLTKLVIYEDKSIKITLADGTEHQISKNKHLKQIALLMSERIEYNF